MKNIFIILLIPLLIPTQALCIHQYKAGDTLYVWAKSGLNLRGAKEIKSEVQTKIPFGDFVIAKEIKHSNEEDERLLNTHLKGRWLKVTYGDYTGFVFDAFLSKYELERVFNSYRGFCNHNFNLETIKDLDCVSCPYDRKNLLIYDNGSQIEEKTYNEAISNFILIHDISQEEVILIFELLYTSEDMIKGLEVKRISENTLSFYYHDGVYEFKVNMQQIRDKMLIVFDEGM